MPERTNPLWDGANELGELLFKTKQEAVKASRDVVPFGKERTTPAEFRKAQEEGGEAVRRSTLEKLTRETGSERLARKEYYKLMGLSR